MNGPLRCLVQEPMAYLVSSRVFQVEDEVLEGGVKSRAVPMPAPTLQPAQLGG